MKLLPPSFANDGISQGTKLEPIMAAVFVNKLAVGWYTRVKYLDDLFCFGVHVGKHD